MHFSSTDKKNFIIDAISAVFYGIFIGSVNPFIPIILKKNSAPSLAIGFVLAAPFLSFIITFYFYPIYSKFRAIDVVTIPSIFSRSCAALLGYFLTHNFIVFTLYLFIQLIEGMTFPAYSKIMKDCYSNEARKFTMSYVRTILGITTIISSVISGKLLDSMYYKLVFTIAGISGAISAINFRHLEFKNQEKNITIGSNEKNVLESYNYYKKLIVETLSNKKFLILNLTVFIYGFGNLLLYGALPTILVDKYHVTNYNIGILTSITSVVQVIAYPIIAFISAKFNLQNAFLFGLFAGLPTVWLLLLSNNYYVLYVIYSLFGIMYSCFDICITLLIISYAESQEIIKYSAVYTLLLGIRGSIATLLANLSLVYVPYNTIIICAGILNFLGFLIGIKLKRKWDPAR